MEAFGFKQGRPNTDGIYIVQYSDGSFGFGELKGGTWYSDKPVAKWLPSDSDIVKLTPTD